MEDALNLGNMGAWEQALRAGHAGEACARTPTLHALHPGHVGSRAARHSPRTGTPAAKGISERIWG